MLLRGRSMNQLLIFAQFVDPSCGKILELGGNGELLSKSPCYMRGYYNKPATTAAKIDDGDWIGTGMISIRQCSSVHTFCPWFDFSTLFFVTACLGIYKANTVHKCSHQIFLFELTGIMIWVCITFFRVAQPSSWCHGNAILMQNGCLRTIEDYY